MFTEKAVVQKSILHLRWKDLSLSGQLDMASAQGVHGGADGDGRRTAIELLQNMTRWL